MIQRHIRHGGRIRQCGGDLHIDLGHGDALTHGGVAVNADMQRFGGLLQTVGYLRCTGYVFKGRGQIAGGLLQRFHIIAVDIYRNAVAGDITHHGHGTVGRYLTVQILAQPDNFLAGLGAGGTLGQGNIGRDIVCAALRGHHAHAAAGGHHGADGFHIFHRGRALEHLVRQLHGGFAVCILRHGNGEVDGIHIDLGHEGKAAGQCRPCAAHKQQQCRRQYDQLMLQRPGNGLAIGGIDTVQQAGFLGLLLLQHTRCHGRHQRQRHDQTGQKRIRHGQRQIGKQLAGDALHKDDGGKHADGRQRRGGDGAQHLLGAGYGGLCHAGALGTQTVDIFNDHHRVIHQHTHRHRKAAE